MKPYLIRVAYDPLSDTIHCGRGRNGRWVGKHDDVTAQAVEAILRYVVDDLGKGGTRDVFFSERGFKITVAPIPAKNGES